MVVEVQAETIIINGAETQINGGPSAYRWLEDRYKVNGWYTVRSGSEVNTRIKGRALNVSAVRLGGGWPWRITLIRPTDGNTIIVTSRGSITQTDKTDEYTTTLWVSPLRTPGPGIWVRNHNHVTNGGAITTTGNGADGILVVDSNTVTNNGRISTSGSGPLASRGISAADNNTITNSGSITTSGRSANGIQAERSNTVTNSGYINTKGWYADGIFAGDNNTVTNSGRINTARGNGNGISAADNNTITNSGRINTNTAGGDGIRVGDNNTITNSGSITTSGRSANGIQADISNTVTNSGYINTKGWHADGIRVGDNNTVTNSGRINTARGDGIRALYNNTVTNHGRINTKGVRAYGISTFFGNRNTFTNHGSINTEGEYASGIRAFDNNTITNSGAINTKGKGADGIRVDDNNRVTNSGSINTEGEYAHGIFALDNNTVTNSGSINTEGKSADGIRVGGNNIVTNSGSINTVTNHGRINTKGDDAAGISASFGNRNTVINSGFGSINTEGEGAHGIWAGRSSNTVTNIGDINTEGKDADGIRVGDNNIVTNSGFGSINTEGEGARGIQARDNNTITNSGFRAINTKGEGARGIQARDKNKITNNSNINTEGAWADGIRVGDNNTVYNSGSINTEGDNAGGIRAFDDNTITNRGAITIKGIGRNFITGRSFGSLNTDGIWARDNNRVTNYGRINTEGELAGGIRAFDKNTVANHGRINTKGKGADGIHVNDNNRVTNSGSINTEGDNATGIRAGELWSRNQSPGYNYNNYIVNDGNIQTTGANASGIVVWGENSFVTNTGRIFTTGRGAAGLRVGNANTGLVNVATPIKVAGKVAKRDIIGTIADLAVTVGPQIVADLRKHILQAGNTWLLNNGEITTTGFNAPGIQVSNKINVVNDIFGRIYVAGHRSAGIRAGNENLLILRGSITSVRGRALVIGDANRVWHSGQNTLRSMGQDSPAVVMGDGNTLINTGRIEATGTGANAHAITGGGNNTLHNSGTISARGGKAVNLSGPGNTLNLLPGAALIGDMNLGPGGRVIVDTAPVNSVFWHGITARPKKRSEGAPFFYNARTRQLATYDIRALAASTQVLGDASGNVSGLMARPGLESATRRRSLIPIATGSAFWLRTFGNRARYRGRGRGDLNPEAGHLGLAAGYDLRLNATQFGLLAGYGRGELRFEGTQRFKPGPSLFKGPFAAFYVRQDFAPFSVQVGLSGGALKHESSRLVNDNLAPNGLARAEARTRSWWLAPEARVGLRLDAGLMQFEPAFTARYAHQSIRGFSETGIRAPATVGQRKVELLETRLELKTVREVGPGRIALKAGWQYRDDLKSNEAQVRLLGESQRVRLESGLGNSFYLGAEAEFELMPGLFLNLSGETVSGDGYRNMSGMVSVYKAF